MQMGGMIANNLNFNGSFHDSKSCQDLRLTQMESGIAGLAFAILPEWVCAANVDVVTIVAPHGGPLASQGRRIAPSYRDEKKYDFLKVKASSNQLINGKTLAVCAFQ